MDLTAWAPAAVAALGFVVNYSKVAQKLHDLKESLDKIDQRNREDHQILHRKIEAEADKREKEDKDIREKYVELRQCILLQHAVPDKAKAAHIGEL
jgi:hypothetical protein